MNDIPNLLEPPLISMRKKENPNKIEFVSKCTFEKSKMKKKNEKQIMGEILIGGDSDCVINNILSFFPVPISINRQAINQSIGNEHGHRCVSCFLIISLLPHHTHTLSQRRTSPDDVN